MLIRPVFAKSYYKKEKILLFFIWTILLFSSVGGSAITANRVSIFIWIITILLLLKINEKNIIIRLFKKQPLSEK